MLRMITGLTQATRTQVFRPQVKRSLDATKTGSRADAIIGRSSASLHAAEGSQSYKTWKVKAASKDSMLKLNLYSLKPISLTAAGNLLALSPACQGSVKFSIPLISPGYSSAAGDGGKWLLSPLPLALGALLLLLGFQAVLDLVSAATGTSAFLSPLISH